MDNTKKTHTSLKILIVNKVFLKNNSKKNRAKENKEKYSRGIICLIGK